MIVIKNGTIVTSEQIGQADLIIEGEKITKISPNITAPEGAEVIDATGLLVLPGGVDGHTHFNLDVGTARAVDDFNTGSIAALCGGTTTIIDHMGFGPAGCSLSHQLEVYHGYADGKCGCDYGFHGVFQHISKEILAEIPKLMEQGLTSFKIYLTYDYRLNDGEVLQVLREMKKLGGITAFHAENHHVIQLLRKEYTENGDITPEYHAKSRPDWCEREAISRLIALSALADHPEIYLVHISSKIGLEEGIRAKEIGNFYIETCPQYLGFTEKCYENPTEGLKYIMSPPLRKQTDCEALWNGIEKGAIDVVGTDHCPFHYKGLKERGLEDFTLTPNGAGGVEERMTYLYSAGVASGKINLSKYVEVSATNPAKIFGIYPQKGTIAVGSDADLVLFHPDKRGIFTKKDLHSACDHTIYEGMERTGEVEAVYLRGKLVVSQNQYLGSQGKFLNRNK
ncbi:MAG: dihydropyrimidinase [Eubacteriales bacterium]